MNGARFVHDELVGYGWDVLVADAQRVKGLAPLACKTQVDARVLGSCRFGDLVPAIWYMLTRNQPFKPFAPAGAIFALTA